MHLDTTEYTEIRTKQKILRQALTWTSQQIQFTPTEIVDKARLQALDSNLGMQIWSGNESENGIESGKETSSEQGIGTLNGTLIAVPETSTCSSRQQGTGT